VRYTDLNLSFQHIESNEETHNEFNINDNSIYEKGLKKYLRKIREHGKQRPGKLSI
jgi:hypothetical protein